MLLVTGCAGFIGYHLARRLLEQGRWVMGLDNLNPYYDVSLKQARLARLQEREGFSFWQADLQDRPVMEELFARHYFSRVVHLAAQAGVRYSLEDPHAYVDSNLTGFVNLLEGCRHSGVEHLIFASSSSVYGANRNQPFSVHDNVDHPVSLYAATKKANELLAHSYSHLYGLPATGLRFFTVYGPWGRPDMALFKFSRAILAGETLPVFNYGRMKRDFTYIDDVVEGMERLLDHLPREDPDWNGAAPDPGTSMAPFRIYNIGHNQPVDLMHFIAVLEKAWGMTASKEFLPLQPGDVPETFADVEDLVREVGYCPSTPVEVGVPRFVDWYREYYGVS